jgi:hypothetical protein
MNLTGSKATFGLQTTFVPTNTNVSGQIQIGKANQTIKLVDANAAYSMQAFFAGINSEVVFVKGQGYYSSATTWVAGTAQVETATAAGTATADGDVTITITASGLTGTPKAIAVPIKSGDTASVWAGKVRTALIADTDVSALFSVSGATTSIVLTRKPSETIEGSNISVPFYVANDSTLNIAISAGTTGVTSAATSVNTTSGVATSGCLVLDCDGKDIEGNALVEFYVNAQMFNAVGNFAGLLEIKNLEETQVFSLLNGSSILINGHDPTYDLSIKLKNNYPASIQYTAIGTIVA